MIKVLKRKLIVSSEKRLEQILTQMEMNNKEVKIIKIDIYLYLQLNPYTKKML